MKTKSIITLILGVTLSLTTNPIFALTSNYSTTRLGGHDRFDTAIEVSKEFAKNDTITNCIIGNCDNFADNISATPLSVYKNAPILLTEKDRLNSKTQQKLADMNIKNIFIVGGGAAVDNNVENQLKSLGYNVTRLGGKDRIETNRAIMNFIPKELWGPYPKVVNGYDWVQGLSIALDTKFIYTSETLAPYVNSTDMDANYEPFTQSDGTTAYRRKTIKTTKTYINPIFIVNSNIFKASDMQDAIDYTDYIYNKWSSEYLADVDDSIFTNANLDAIHRYNQDYESGIKVRPAKYEVEAMANVYSNFHHYVNKLPTCYRASGGVTTKILDIKDNIYTNLKINRMYNDINIELNKSQQKTMYTFSSSILTKYDDFIDALSVAPLSAKYSIPIVLIDKSLDKMPNIYTHIESIPMAPTIDSYKNVSKVYYIGGTDTLPDGSENFIK